MKNTERHPIRHLVVITIFTISLASAINGMDPLSCCRFGLNFGGGPSYSMYAAKLTADNLYWGVELLFSPYKFPENYGASIHANHYFAKGSIRISPSFSIGHRKGTPPFQLYDREYDCGWISVNIDFNGYITNHIYIRHQYGIETILGNSKWILPSYGIGIGYDLKNAIYKDCFYLQNKLFNALGFGLGSLLIVGFNMLYMSILTWD